MPGAHCDVSLAPNNLPRQHNSTLIPLSASLSWPSPVRACAHPSGLECKYVCVALHSAPPHTPTPRVSHPPTAAPSVLPSPSLLFKVSRFLMSSAVQSAVKRRRGDCALTDSRVAGYLITPNLQLNAICGSAFLLSARTHARRRVDRRLTDGSACHFR